MNSTKERLLEAITRNPGQTLYFYKRDLLGNISLMFSVEKLKKEGRVFGTRQGSERLYRYYPVQSSKIKKVAVFITYNVILSPHEAHFGGRLVKRLRQDGYRFDVSNYELVEKDRPEAKKGEYLIQVSMVPEVTPAFDAALERFRLEVIEQE